MICKQQIYVDLSLLILLLWSYLHPKYTSIINLTSESFSSAQQIYYSSAFKLTATLNFFSGYKKKKLINKSITITI